MLDSCHCLFCHPSLENLSIPPELKGNQTVPNQLDMDLLFPEEPTESQLVQYGWAEPPSIFELESQRKRDLYPFAQIIKEINSEQTYDVSVTNPQDKPTLKRKRISVVNKNNNEEPYQDSKTNSIERPSLEQKRTRNDWKKEDCKKIVELYNSLSEEEIKFAKKIGKISAVVAAIFHEFNKYLTKTGRSEITTTTLSVRIYKSNDQDLINSITSIYPKDQDRSKKKPKKSRSISPRIWSEKDTSEIKNIYNSISEQELNYLKIIKTIDALVNVLLPKIHETFTPPLPNECGLRNQLKKGQLKIWSDEIKQTWV